MIANPNLIGERALSSPALLMYQDNTVMGARIERPFNQIADRPLSPNCSHSRLGYDSQTNDGYNGLGIGDRNGCLLAALAGVMALIVACARFLVTQQPALKVCGGDMFRFCCRLSSSFSPPLWLSAK